MEEKIYQKLIQSLGKTSLTERTIKAKAARLSKKITTEEQLTDDAISDAVEDLRDVEGQLNHEVKSAVEKQIAEKTKELEDKFKGGKNPNDEGNRRFELPKEIQEELEANRKFRQDYEKKQAAALEQAKREKLLSEVKTQLISKEGGCKEGIALKLAMSKFDESADVATNVAKLKEAYNTETANILKEGFTPAFSGGGPIPPKELSDEDVKKLEEAGY